LHSIFVSERVITVSKPKDRKDPKSPEKPKEFQSTERKLKGKKSKRSTENQQVPLEKPNRKRVQILTNRKTQ